MSSKAKLLVAVVIVIAVTMVAVGSLMVFNKSPDLIDSEFAVIVTGSMDGEPTDYEISTIPVNSMIAVHKMKGDMVNDVKIGDVIGYYSPALGANIYHRVIVIDTENRTFEVKGDANVSSEIISFDEANGIVVNVNHEAGEVVTFVKTNLLFLIVIVVCLFVMIEAVSILMKLWKE